MNDRLKRSLVRFLKIFAFSFLAVFVYLAKPLVEGLSVNGFDALKLFGQFIEIAEIAGIAGFVGAIEKYASWEDRTE